METTSFSSIYNHHISPRQAPTPSTATSAREHHHGVPASHLRTESPRHRFSSRPHFLRPLPTTSSGPPSPLTSAIIHGPFLASCIPSSLPKELLPPLLELPAALRLIRIKTINHAHDVILPHNWLPRICRPLFSLFRLTHSLCCFCEFWIGWKRPSLHLELDAAGNCRGKMVKFPKYLSPFSPFMCHPAHFFPTACS